MMRFKRVYIEITNICNLSCKFCSPVLREKRRMSMEEFKRIISEIKPYCEYVYFHIKGEPTTHPLIIDFMKICEENGIKVNLTTNGVLVPRLAESFLHMPSLRQINISLHSLSQQENTDKEKYLNEIFRFAESCRDEDKPLIVLRIWNLHKDKLDEENAFIFNKICEYFGVTKSFTELLSMQRITIDRGIFLSLDDEFRWPDINDPIQSEDGFCYGTRAMIGILCDGTVVPCCLDSNGGCAFGNIYEKSLSDILSSEKFKNVFSGFGRRKVYASLCRRCTYRKRFDK